MESTLSIKLAELKARTGSYLGWGRGEEYGDAPYSSEQEFELDGILDGALHRVYFPHLTDNSPAYEWSFLRPTLELTLDADGSTLELPQDFNGVAGPITLVLSGGITHCQLQTTSESRIDGQHAAYPTSTGRPSQVAVRPHKGTTTDRGQRWGLYLWPSADQQYTVKFQYHLIPDALTPANPFCYGGAPMREVFLESCLALAEQRLDDSSTIHAMEFDRRLMASISQDRKLKPSTLGPNLDRSGDRIWYRDRGHNLVTFNGVTYD